MSDKTIFQKIIDREIPSEIWYEDKVITVFFDINPVSFGHSLVISKTPYPWIQDVPPLELGEIFQRIPMLINNLKSATNCDFVKLSVVGTDVPHFHLHLIPINQTNEKAHEAAPDINLKQKDRSELLRSLQSGIQQ